MTVSALKSVFIGVGGSLILAAFCCTFIAVDKVLFIFPVFIGFNGMVTGYRLVDMLRERIANVPVFSFVLGVGGGAVTFVAVNFSGSFMPDAFSLDIYDLAIYMVVSGITSYLGAKLAVRYFSL
jgi:uncharacterized protein YacL